MIEVSVQPAIWKYERRLSIGVSLNVVMARMNKEIWYLFFTSSYHDVISCRQGRGSSPGTNGMPVMG